MGDIGKDVREIEVLPLEQPQTAPVHEPSTPAPEREPEKVPA